MDTRTRLRRMKQAGGMRVVMSIERETAKGKLF